MQKSVFMLFTWKAIKPRSNCSNSALLNGQGEDVITAAYVYTGAHAIHKRLLRNTDRKKKKISMDAGCKIFLEVIAPP